jgi:hypothetical protein
MVQHARDNEIKVIGAAIADEDRAVERHLRIGVDAEINIIGRLFHRDMDCHDLAGNLQRCGAPQSLNVVEDALRCRVIDQLDIGLLRVIRHRLSPWYGARFG